jgi:nucleoside 2-deoxyribosyltransferase
MSKPTVYLAGPITGLTYDGASDWRDYAKKRFDALGIEAFSPMRAKHYLKDVGVLQGSGQNYKGLSPLSENKGITTRDRMDCTRRDLVLANLLGAKKVSAGTCIEFGWADAARRPVVLVMEKEGNPHEHGMVLEIGGYRVEDLDQAIDLTASILLP